MGVTKEIWASHIVGGLFASNSVLSKVFRADDYVKGKTVHIPNAGAASGVQKNRSSVPASAKKRTDTDVTFQIDEFTTDPIYIPNAETIELSYDKRESVLGQDRLNLEDNVTEAAIKNWFPSAKSVIETTGAEVDAYTSAEATGKRKGLCKADVLALMTKFNGQNIPQKERYLLLDAQMYSQLLGSLTENESSAFSNSADTENGIVGKLYSFNVMLRSRVAVVTNAKAVKEWSEKGAATDCAAALAFHKNSLCAALGAVKVFENVGDPQYYGDIYSFLVRSGASKMRSDEKGIVALVQGTAA